MVGGLQPYPNDEERRCSSVVKEARQEIIREAIVKGNGYRILLAEDDASVARLLQGELQRAGYEVEICGDGAEALRRTLSWSPHLVILDHYMPEVDGQTACTRLRELGARVRIIFVSAAGELNDRLAGLDAGADDYICKPYDVEELLARVRAQLRDTQPLSPPEPMSEALVRALTHRDAAIRSAAEEGIQRSGEAGLHFKTLGDFVVLWHGIDLTRLLWNRRKPRLLLKLLLCRYGQVTASDVIMENLWPELPPANARRSLHVCVQRLRSSLLSFGADRIRSSEGGYAFHLLPEDTLDLRSFEDLTRSIASFIQEKKLDTHFKIAVQRLMDLYVGDLFSDEPYLDWVAAMREGLRNTFVNTVSRASAYCREQGDREMACTLLYKLLEIDPTDEPHALDLVECLLEEGDAAGATALLARTQRVLRDELGMPPSRRLQGLLDACKTDGFRGLLMKSQGGQ